MTQLICVDPDRVHIVWPKVRDGIAEALRKGAGGLFSELENDVLSGRALVWLAVKDKSDIRGTCITQLLKTERGLVCSVMALAGARLKEWFGHLPAIEQFARDEGCVAMTLNGRKAWTRLLKDYRQTAVTMQKEL